MLESTPCLTLLKEYEQVSFCISSLKKKANVFVVQSLNYKLYTMQ